MVFQSLKPENMRDRYVEIDGLRLRYWLEGEGDPVVLIHGLAVSIESWEKNIWHLAENHKVIAFDIPGFGLSTRLSNRDFYSFDNAYRFLYRVIEKVCTFDVPITLVGNSMGGLVALKFALAYPSLVSKLVLVDSAGLGKEIFAPIKMQTIWPIGELLLQPNNTTVRLIAKILIHRHDLITEEFVSSMVRYSQILGTKDATLNLLRTGVNLSGQVHVVGRDELRKLRLPVLVIWGRNDRIFPYRHAQYALENIASCFAIVLDHAGHAPQIDRAEEFNKVLVEFLNSSQDQLRMSYNAGCITYL